jgi:hypothetical protein
MYVIRETLINECFLGKAMIFTNVKEKTMANKRFWLGMLVMVLAFGMTVLGCGDGSSNNDPYIPPVQTPLTGTVTVTSNITVSSGIETMTLTADTSALNGTSDIFYFYQWMREGSNISNARSKTYVVVEADYGKALSVKVTSSVLSGEQSGSFTVQTPTICNVSVKYASTTNSAGRKRVYFERADGTSLGYTSTGLGTTAENVKLTSWNVNQFKMRIDYTFFDSKYYFKKPSTTDELFDLTTGIKSYTLTYNYDTNVVGYYSNLFATAE